MQLVNSFGKKQWIDQTVKQMRRSPTKHEGILDKALKIAFPNGLFMSQWAFGDSIFDFYAPLSRFAVEVDGPSHSSSKGKANDLLKMKEAERRGIVVFRVTNSEVEKDSAAVVSRIKSALAELPFRETGKWGWTLSKKERAELKHQHPSDDGRPPA